MLTVLLLTGTDTPAHAYEGGPKVELTAGEKAWLAEHPVLTIHTEEDTMFPYSFKDQNGEAQGVIKDYAEAITKRLNVTIKLNSVKFEKLNKLLEMGKVDVKAFHVESISPSKSRYRLTRPFVSGYMSLFAKKGDYRSITDLVEFKGKRVAALRGTDLDAPFFQDLANHQVIFYDDIAQGIRMVLQGDADAIYELYPTINATLKTNFITTLEPIFITKKALHGSFAIRKEWPELVSIFDKVIEDIRTHEMPNILRKWHAAIEEIKSERILLTKEEKAWLAEHPTYTVSSYPLAPYIMQEGGKVTGYMTELLRMISAKVNLTPRFIYNEVSSEALRGIQTGEVEASMGRIGTPQLSKHVTFSPDTLLLNLAIFAQKGTKSMNSVEALKGKRIASYKGYSMHSLFVKYFPDTQLVLADNAQEMLRLVATGKADAAMQELHSGQYMLSKYLMNNLEVKGFAKFEGVEPLYGHLYLVHKSVPLLKSILDKAYKALALSERQALWDEWFGKRELSDIHDIQLTAEEKAWLAEHPVIRLGNSVDWPPIGFINKEGIYSGIAADYMKYIEGLLGVRIKPSMLEGWKSTVEAAKAGEVDMLASIVRTPQREIFLTFSKPYLSYPIGIITKENVSFIADVQELKGRPVAVNAGSATHDILSSNYPDLDLLPVKNTKAGLMTVARRETFAYISDMVTSSNVMVQEGLTSLKISGELPYRYDISIGIRKDQPILSAIMQKALDAIPEEEHNVIKRKWLSVTFEHKADHTLLWQILAAVTIVLAAFLYWNRRLSREVNRRHQAEKELQKAHGDLEIRVEERTVELAKANEELESEIIERVKAEEKVKGSLHEKEILLREVHHRVKNNMQVIISLLRLQADRIKDEEYAVMLKDSQLRIQSMSLIHEKLYQSKDFANIDFKSYVKSLATNLFQSNGVNPDRIKLELTLENISLDLETAIPCGLIINELISNSMKYAFPEEREGKISVSLSSTDGDELELIVADNGTGLPEDMDIGKTETLGLYLVKMLTERQLDGSIDLNRNNGTEYRISLKKQSYKQRI